MSIKASCKLLKGSSYFVLGEKRHEIAHRHCGTGYLKTNKLKPFRMHDTVAPEHKLSGQA